MRNHDLNHYDRHFEGVEKRQSRQERKILSNKDRSKYKETDQRQKEKLKKDEDRSSYKRGRVTTIDAQGIAVQEGEHRYRCSLRGNLQKEKGKLKRLAVVGDWVLFEPLNATEGVIAEIEERRTILARADNLSRIKQQLVAANVDQLIIVVSVVSPPLKPGLVDRYLIAADKGGMEALLLINKIDLLDDPQHENDKEHYQEFLQAYSSANLKIIPCSTITGQGIEDIREAMKDKTSVFAGQSGVGKSSLINAATGFTLKTGETVFRTRKGSHTTTQANLLPLPQGGFCVDTPGIQSFGLWQLERDEIACYFNEFAPYISQCKFADCLHDEETSCAVKDAVNEGKIHPLRYLSYLSLIKTLDDKHLRR